MIRRPVTEGSDGLYWAILNDLTNRLAKKDQSVLCKAFINYNVRQ